MVKAKDFWNHLCEGLDYRFFSGVACSGLSKLYKNMNSKFMHYIPAANECIALGLANGIYISGLRGGIIMDMQFKYDINRMLSFNMEYKIPILIIGYGDKSDKFTHRIPTECISGNFKEELSVLIESLESRSVPGLALIGKGVIS